VLKGQERWSRKKGQTIEIMGIAVELEGRIKRIIHESEQSWKDVYPNELPNEVEIRANRQYDEPEGEDNFEKAVEPTQM
jgi:hypothetical protein